MLIRCGERNFRSKRIIDYVCEIIFPFCYVKSKSVSMEYLEHNGNLVVNDLMVCISN